MMLFLSRVIALVIKEFLALLKDPKSRVVLIVPPVFQLLVFGYAATFDLNEVPFAVYDEDGGEAARELLARFRGSTTFKEVERISHEEQIAPLIDSSKALLIVHIGPTFTREILRGRTGAVQVIVDGRNSNTAMIALNYVRTLVIGFNEQWAAKSGKNALPAALKPRSWYNPNQVSRWFIVPGIVALLTLVVTMMVTALSVAREREQGTFDQLLVTPFTPAEILLGKMMPGFIVGMVEASFIILVAVFWFDVPLRGHLLTLYTGLALFLASAIGVGLMISSLAVTMQQGLLGGFLFLVPAITLSGFTTPIANMPLIIQRLTLLNPMRYFVIILRSVFLEGAAFETLLSQFWPMALIAAVCLTAAGFLFRHRLY